MTDDTHFQIEREDDGRVLRIALDRPQQRNAMSRAMVAGMLSLFDELADKAPARAVILHGNGRGFCAGSDLGELAAMNEAERAAFERDCGELASRINACPAPVIAAVHGFAIGGGLTLAAACDIVISAEDAIWSLPEVPIGLFPAWGLGAVDDRVGLARARRLAMGLERLTGAGAAEAGLADRVDADPMACARALATQLHAMPAAQLAQVKAHYGRGNAWSENDVEANRRFIAATRSPEARESFLRFGKR